MRKDKPSRTALKVALNIVTLGSKPAVEAILPAGIVDATLELLAASTQKNWGRTKLNS